VWPPGWGHGLGIKVVGRFWSLVGDEARHRLGPPTPAPALASPPRHQPAQTEIRRPWASARASGWRTGTGGQRSPRERQPGHRLRASPGSP